MLDTTNVKKEDIPKYLKEQKNCPVWSTFDKIRGLVGAEGCRWKTIVGKDGSFAAEPHPNLITFWVYDHKERKLYTPEILETNWSLAEKQLPISIVKWETEDIKMETTIFAEEIDSGDRLINFARTSIRNKGSKEKELSLYVVIRHSGLSKRRDAEGVKEIDYGSNNFVRVNKRICLYFDEKPDAFGASSFKDGDIWEFAKDGLLPPNEKVTDEFGYASGAVVYRFKLNPNEEKTYDFKVPSEERGKSNSIDIMKESEFISSLKSVKEYWRARVPLELNLPDKEYLTCFYASIYYILIEMTGRELWPGPYYYDSFTLHDAVEMADALDKVGLREVANGALAYFNYKDDDAYLDGLGGSIYALYEHYRITQDKKWLEGNYSKMLEGSQKLKALRAKQLVANLKDSPIYGLLPESMSQDNFTKKAHLYVDNWWGLIGLKATLEAAKVLKKEDDLRWLTEEYKDFLVCLIESFEKVMERDQVSYLPAFADYCPPSERIIDSEHRILGETQMAWAHRPALFPSLSLSIDVPLDLLKQSYESYWKKSGKFSGYDGGWYVEYEKYFWGYNVMLAHAPLFLGMEDVTLKNIEWSVKHQSCPGGWMEAMNTRINEQGLVEMDEGVVCDIPHGWTAAHYVLLLRNMLLREDKGKLILLSCVPEIWVEEGKCIEVRKAPTYFGEANFCLKSYLKKGFLKLTLNFKEAPPEGYILVSPLKEDIKAVEIDGKEWEKFEKRKVVIPPQSKEILVYYTTKK